MFTNILDLALTYPMLTWLTLIAGGVALVVIVANTLASFLTPAPPATYVPFPRILMDPSNRESVLASIEMTKAERDYINASIILSNEEKVCAHKELSSRIWKDVHAMYVEDLLKDAIAADLRKQS